MYTTEEEIIHFIFKAFNNKKRIKEDIDLVFHSIMVGNMLKNEGCTDEVVYIGYLHDIIEDTKYDYAYLKDKYGKVIADAVLNLSEDKSIIDYKERKLKFINSLSKVSNDILMVELADKLQNLISDYSNYIKAGKEELIVEAYSFENLKWYYVTLQGLFNNKLESNNLLDRYNKIIEVYFK